MILLQFKNISRKGTKFAKLCTSYTQKANITGRNTRGGPAELQTPFPYEEKPFRWYNSIFDSTMVRICEENAKILVIEGSVGVGKSALAEVLAEQLDMKFMPQPTMDEIYLLPSGYDLRQHDHELPKEVRSYDHKNFCVNPKHPRVGYFQNQMLYLRFFQYIDALCHVLNTGQGVILERSYHSDYVFMKSMYEQEFASKEVYNAHSTVFKNINCFFPPPHLIIYLDTPVPVVQERIKKRNYSYEQNSPALTAEYLECLEKNWKQDYLKKAKKNSEILVYDWVDGGDADVIIEDIEKLDFDVLRRDNKFYEWRIPRKKLNYLRSMVTNHKRFYIEYFSFDSWNTPEFCIPNHKLLEIDKMYQKIPECAYEFGYNTSMGDSILSILFKDKVEKHRHMRHHLRFYRDEGY